MMNGKKPNPTFNDIAAYTNFSKTTISRYFNKPDSLTPENRKIIQQALIDLDYKENRVAQILARGSTDFVGIIMPNFYLHYFSEMLEQILLTYEDYGYKFLIFAGNKKKDVEKQYLEELMAYHIEGLLVMSHTLPSEELAKFPVPVVSIEREDRCISSVNCDNFTGGVMATELLADCCCDVLIHINTPTPESIPAWHRIRGFQSVCEERNLKHEIIIEEMGLSHTSGSKAMSSILERLEKNYEGLKKGLFFSDDTHANEMLNLLVRRFGKLPDDYQLVGYDNSPVAESAVYPMSTIGQQIDRIAREAVDLLDQLIRKRIPGTEPVHRIISPVLVKRETTK